MTTLLEKIGKRLWEWLQTPLHPVVSQESRELPIGSDADISDQGVAPPFMPGFSTILEGATFTTQELWQFLGWESMAAPEAALPEDLAAIPWEDEIDDLSALPWEEEIPTVSAVPSPAGATATEAEVPIEMLAMLPEEANVPLPDFMIGMDRIPNWDKLPLPELFAQISWSTPGDLTETAPTSTASEEDLSLLGDLLITMPE